MTDTRATDVLTRLLHDWQQAFNAHRPAGIAALFSQDALFQGISPKLGHGPQEIFDYYARVPRGTTAQVKVISGGQLSQETVHGFAEVTFTAATGDVHLICLSIVAKRAGGVWLIHQYHASTHHMGGGSAVRQTINAAPGSDPFSPSCAQGRNCP
ncbi:YybH family protein [Nonomuraea sp. CA-218870]|uniref:Nuclear transport factor 2 family protein n=1 Tax=Nonomuraea corallina TaxID=2989783 RepID=A0ABT4SH44_9ACTN|nr:nuclear transport factor 2 family protein [Nonomuraea corallina]MDA0636469.1 nuclear transport factor 2 family protein [Nonomuraea corallina]